MFKPSLTVHKSPKGKLTVLSVSENADEAVNAYVECKEAGEVQLIVRGQLQKQKKIRDIEAEKKRKAAEAKKVEAAKKKEEAEAKKAAAAEAKKVEAAKPKE